MAHADFVHLHVHTNYSLLDGACRIPDLIKKAAELRFPALAMTDHGNLFGAVEFYEACMKGGIKPIIGCEAYLAPQDRRDRTGSGIIPRPATAAEGGTGQTGPFGPVAGRGIKDSNCHLVLLAKDEEGYTNLTQLVTLSYLEGFYYKPRIDKELLRTYGKGLIALTSCLKGVLNVHLTQDQTQLARQHLDELIQIMGKDNVYVELQHHGLEAEAKVRPQLAALAKEAGVKVVATNDVHYLAAAHAQAHDALMAIQTQTTIDDPHRLRYEVPEFYLKSAEQMKALFAEYPEAVASTLEIADRCNLELDFSKTHLPNFEVPSGTTQERYLRDLCYKGLARRYPAITPELEERMAKELGVIQHAGYTSYFLIVWDFIRFAKQQGIPVGPGRGSAAGSLVSYTLGITDLDPLKYGLLFERFLNPQRVSLPDIDIDFCYERRQEVIDYVIKKYGQNCVAQIITFGTMQAKAVVRDVARAMKITYAEADRIAKLIPNELDITLEKAMADVPELAEMYKANDEIRQLIDTGKVLEGLTRHASTHAAGLVIADKPLVNYMPLFKTSEGMITTGCEMKALEKLGLLKIDLLGLRTLTVVEDACKLIRKTRNVPLDLEGLELDDAPTYEMLCRSETGGVFQLESGGMRDLLRKLKPSQFEDLIAVLALYRPGPIGSGMLDDFIKRKHRQIPVRYDHPRLEPILKETYGVCLTGDTLIDDARTGIRYRLDQLPLDSEVIVQGVDVQYCQATAPVLRTFDNGIKPVYRVRLRNGREIKMTHDHRVLTEGGWKPIGDCRVGDYIATPRSLIAQQDTYDARRLRVLAYLIADGDLSNKGSVNFVSKDPDLLGEYERCLESFELVHSHRILQVRGVMRVTVSKPAGAPVAYHTPNGLLAFLREHGLKDQRGGCRSWEKFVPSFVFSLNQDCLGTFVAALWDCDGFVGDKMCHYVTTSRKLADDVQALLLKLGISSTVYDSRYQTEHHGVQTRYQITVYDGERFGQMVQPFMRSQKGRIACRSKSDTTISRQAFFKELASIVGNESKRSLQRRFGIDRQHFSPRRRQCDRIEGRVIRPAVEALELAGSLQLLRLQWEPIKEIEPAGSERVYDLEVANVHNFVANGIIVHNCVYQEQVMRIASDLGGFSLAQADLLRRAMGKKIAEVMESQRKAFVEGCQKNKITERLANRTFDLMEHFSGYGFNKSHATAYALISYRTAYLKAHYPVEFMAALMNSEMGNTDKLVAYLEEARRIGIKVLPPDVNHSESGFAVIDEHTLRCGLGIIKNVGFSAIESVVKARQTRGTFDAIQSLCDDLDLRLVNRKVLESLIKAGACDSMGLSRAALLAGLDQALEEAATRQMDKQRGQFTLFDALNAVPEGAPPAPKATGVLRDWPESQKLAFEKTLLGFYVSGHPLARYESVLKQVATATSQQLLHLPESATAIVGGILNKIKLTTTKKTNEQMAVCYLEDLHGEIEVLVFPNSFAQLSPQLKPSALVFIEGRVAVRNDQPRLIAQQIIPLEQGMSRLIKAVEVVLQHPSVDRELLDQLKGLLSRFPGTMPIYLTLSAPESTPTRLKLSEGFQVSPHPELLQELSKMFGEQGVVIRRQPPSQPSASRYGRPLTRPSEVP